FGLLSCQRAVEGLQFRAADGALPALGLHVDLLQPQRVQRDHAVNAPIAAAAHLLQGASVSPSWRSLIRVLLGSLANACSAVLASWKNTGSCSLRKAKLLLSAMFIP